MSFSLLLPPPLALVFRRAFCLVFNYYPSGPFCHIYDQFGSFPYVLERVLLLSYPMEDEAGLGEREEGKSKTSHPSQSEDP
jgi:hypothetical protein